MFETIKRTKEVYRQQGLGSVVVGVLPYLYRQVRPFLPSGPYPRYNGIPIGTGKTTVLDPLLPWDTPDRNDSPEYEEELLSALKEEVDTGDKVMIIGGGKGVSSVVAAQETGESGEVVVYEGSDHWYEVINETLKINDVAEWCNVIHAIVSEDVGVYTDRKSQTIVEPDELPECDVLEMDCEGAEISILKGLEIRPETVIVESHGQLDSPTKDVKKTLISIGYEIVEIDPISNENYDDMKIITAKRASN